MAGAASCEIPWRLAGPGESGCRCQRRRENLWYSRRAQGQRAFGQLGARSPVRQSDSAASASGKERNEGCDQRGRDARSTYEPDDATPGEIALSERQMKKIEAIFKPFKLDEIKEALAKERIQRFSLLEVKGAGCHQIIIKQYRGVTYSEDSIEVSVAVVVDDDEADRIAQTLVTTLRSGDLCDGEVAIMPVERLIHVRVGK